MTSHRFDIIRPFDVGPDGSLSSFFFLVLFLSTTSTVYWDQVSSSTHCAFFCFLCRYVLCVSCTSQYTSQVVPYSTV